ncbi:MAG: hypothetical protein V3W14_00575 [Candidatus Neomarinimicrobiota bacterium]
MLNHKILILIIGLTSLPAKAAGPGPPVWPCLPTSGSAVVLARVGPDSITFENFTRQFAQYREITGADDSLADRLSVLESIIAETTLLAAGRDQGLFENPEITRAGYLAWRNAILTAVARAHFAEEVNDDIILIESEYRFRNTTMHTRFLKAGDSLLAVQYREAIEHGAPFESLALQVFRPSRLFEQPWDLGWKYPQELDSSYARLAYQLNPGDISLPIPANGDFLLVQLLGADFRPDHGHFERVKHYEQIREQLPAADRVNIQAADDILTEWAAGLPIKWRRWGIRKALRSGIISRSWNTIALSAPDPELLETELIELYGESFTLDWLLSRLELLPPDGRNGIKNNRAFRDLLRLVLKWDRMMDLAAALPSADSLMQAAEELRRSTVRRAVIDSVLVRLTRAYVPPADSIQAYLAANTQHYIRPALVDIEEIVMRDSTQAAAVMASYVQGASFGQLASEHTLREWARERAGRLGWVPVIIYAAAADSIANSAPGTVIGPLPVDDYYLLAIVREIQPAGLPEPETLLPRLRYDWLRENRNRLYHTWVAQLQRTSYPVFVDTSLLAPPAPVPDEPVLPVPPADSLTISPDTADMAPFLPEPDSLSVDSVAVPEVDTSVAVPQLPDLIQPSPDSLAVDSLAVPRPPGQTDSSSVGVTPPPR